MMIASNIEDQLEVQVRIDDGLSQRVCLKCECRLERGIEDLWDFCSQACTSYERLLAVHIGRLECTKDRPGQP